MSVSRTDYLMYGAKIDPKLVDYDKHEAEICGAPAARFDMVYDGMSGKYAVAGKIIAKIDGYDGTEFIELGLSVVPADAADIWSKVTGEFGDVGEFKLVLFSHYS